MCRHQPFLSNHPESWVSFIILTFRNSKCRRPLWSEYIQTDTAVTVNIWVVNSCCKCNLKEEIKENESDVKPKQVCAKPMMLMTASGMTGMASGCRHGQVQLHLQQLSFLCSKYGGRRLYCDRPLAMMSVEGHSKQCRQQMKTWASYGNVRLPWGVWRGSLLENELSRRKRLPDKDCQSEKKEWHLHSWEKTQLHFLSTATHYQVKFQPLQCEYMCNNTATDMTSEENMSERATFGGIWMVKEPQSWDL